MIFDVYSTSTHNITQLFTLRTPAKQRSFTKHGSFTFFGTRIIMDHQVVEPGWTGHRFSVHVPHLPSFLCLSFLFRSFSLMALWVTTDQRMHRFLMRVPQRGMANNFPLHYIALRLYHHTSSIPFSRLAFAVMSWDFLICRWLLCCLSNDPMHSKCLQETCLYIYNYSFVLAICLVWGPPWKQIQSNSGGRQTDANSLIIVTLWWNNIQ